MDGWRKVTGAVGVVIGMGGCVLPLEIHIDDDVRIEGSGHVVTVTRHVAAFDAVEVSGPVTVLVDRTGREGVEVSAEDNLMQYLETFVSGGVLHVGIKPGYSFRAHREIVFWIESYEVVELQASGAASVDLEVGRVEDLWLTISGASSLVTRGTADVQELHVSGASRYDGFDLKSYETYADVSGASQADVWAEELLDVVASGASHVRYLGWPVVALEVSGGSSVTPY